MGIQVHLWQCVKILKCKWFNLTANSFYALSEHLVTSYAIESVGTLKVNIVGWSAWLFPNDFIHCGTFFELAFEYFNTNCKVVFLSFYIVLP